ncbi:MAG TPA: hypothetical protein VG963_09655, partial [Polyangiaceae bacterium]|nr:hypothetical protein [Polyangiaceae bacterium]
LDAAHSKLPRRWLPSFITYFTEAAALFPNAAQAIIDYRVEGWECSEQRWREIDPRVDFPIDADSKENRFYRALHFFRQNRPVMHALEAYLIERHNARAREAREDVGLIGGIRTLSLRLPVPEPGEHVERYSRQPIDAHPASQRHNWYWTPASRRAENCGLPSPRQEAEARHEAAPETVVESVNALQPSGEEP